MKRFALLLTFILLLSIVPGCSNSTKAPYSPSDLGKMEEKKYADATLDDDFADDRIIVSIQNAYSLAFHTYTPEDFPEIKCINVEDLTTASRDRAKAIVEGNPLPTEPGMSQPDIQKYHQILCITLKIPGRKMY